jgi:hypothetical protein
VEWIVQFLVPLIVVAVLGGAAAALCKLGDRVGGWLWDLRTQGLWESLRKREARNPSTFWAEIAVGSQTALAVGSGLLLYYEVLAGQPMDPWGLFFGVPILLAPLFVYWVQAMAVAAIVRGSLAAGGILLVVEGLLVLALVRSPQWAHDSHAFFGLPATPTWDVAELFLGALPLLVGILVLVSWWKSRGSEAPEDTNRTQGEGA